MLTSSVSSSQWCKPLVFHLLCDAWLVTLSSNFLADWYLHVTSQTSFSTSSCNQFSTAGLIHNDERFEMPSSCPSLSKELLEKIVCTWKTKCILQEAYTNIWLLRRIGNCTYWNERVFVHIKKQLLTVLLKSLTKWLCKGQRSAAEWHQINIKGIITMRHSPQCIEQDTQPCDCLIACMMMSLHSSSIW